MPKSNILAPQRLITQYLKAILIFMWKWNYLNFKKSITLVESLNFQVKLDTLQTSELCMLESTQEEDVAIELLAKGSTFRSFVTFRDYLRSSQDLVEQYNQLKLNCAALSMDEYRARKTHFIHQVLNQ